MSLTVFIFTFALFFAMIMNMASSSKVKTRINSFLLTFTVVSGIVVYAVGYAQTTGAAGDAVTAVLRATLGVCGMFLAKNDWSAIASAPVFQSNLMVAIFWLAHTLAIYLTASAAIASVGAEALKKLHLLLARRGKLVLVFGSDAEAVSFGCGLNGEKGNSVVFVSGGLTSESAAAISKAGAVIRSEANAVHPDAAFIKSLGISGGRRSIEVYAMDANENENLRFAGELLACFKEAGVKPEQTSVSIIGSENAIGSRLDASESNYGYGSVSIYRRSELPARQMILQYPPYNYISFDENGRATEDFNCVIIGFGSHGQAVLKQLIMNGQFEGSTFRAAVFAPHCLDAAGYFRQEAPCVFEKYNIEFHDCDGRSYELYDYLWKNRKNVKYIAVCAGPENVNCEIASELVEYNWRRGIHTPVIQCWHFGVRTQSAPGAPVIKTSCYTRECLSAAYADAGAMALNHVYSHDPNSTPMDDWKRCDHFSRMSSRASADFVPAYLKIVGKTADEAIESWELSPEMRENLGRTEHHRWCAFHYAMGFSPMELSEWNERAAEYKKDMEEKGSSTVRISKNLAGRTHACLVTWEELPELDKRESAVTGKYCNYQQADLDNIDTIPVLLKDLKELRK